MVIIVEDAQTMCLKTLEDLRLPSNLETDKRKLLHMLPVGQPELLTHLDPPHMRQLRQRVAICCHLDYFALTLEIGLPILSALEENERYLPSKPMRRIAAEIKMAVRVDGPWPTTL